MTRQTLYNRGEYLISLYQSVLQMKKDKHSIDIMALDVALHCITLVQNLDAVYNACDANEATIYSVQDILEQFFKEGEENVFSK